MHYVSELPLRKKDLHTQLNVETTHKAVQASLALSCSSNTNKEEYIQFRIVASIRDLQLRTLSTWRHFLRMAREDRPGEELEAASSLEQCFTAFLPFCLSPATFLPSAAGPRNGRKAERQNVSAAAEMLLPPQICHESFVGLGFKV
jgi:hypothetical protein